MLKKTIAMSTLALLFISIILNGDLGVALQNGIHQNSEKMLNTFNKLEESINVNTNYQFCTPNYFTENCGQIGNESVRFYIQGEGIWFLDDMIWFEIREPIKEPRYHQDPIERFESKFVNEDLEPRESTVIKLTFEGANKITPKGVGILPHRSNFFYGNDSSKWCTNVPNYHEIVYKNLWDGIDLIYRSQDSGGLKYEFVVRPRADHTRIKVRVKGHNDLLVDESGALVLRTLNSGYDIRDTNLKVFYADNTENTIPARFSLLDKNTYTFLLQNRDMSRTVIIDPLVYSTFIGGSSADYGYGIAVDGSGYAYITGSTYSSNFSTTPGANDTTHNGDYDVFVVKLNPPGSALVYSTFIGGSNRDYGWDIAVDSYGFTYITGFTYSSNFPTTPGANDTTHNGYHDVFAVKLNLTGSALVYSTFIGGKYDDYGRGIALDGSGDAYITGETSSFNFPTTPSAYDTTFNGGILTWDIFVVKLNSTGSALVYSTFIGSSSHDHGNGITVDGSGYAYITGYSSSSWFPTTPGAYDTTYNGYRDVIVVKLNPTGSARVYSTYIGGNDYEEGNGIALDGSGDAYITGYTRSSNFPTTPGAYDTTHNGYHDVFVVKLNLTGSSLVYSTFIGGSSSNDVGYDVTVDSSGDAYITGYTRSSNFPTTPDANDTTFNGGNYDGFAVKLNLTSSTLVYSTFIGGNNDDYGYGIALDSSGIAYITGYTGSSNFPNTTGAYDTTYNGGWDCFILKLLTSINNIPTALDLRISETVVYRNNSIYLYSNGTDIEDLEKNLTPHFEYRDPNEQVWNSTYFSAPQYQNSKWYVSFTPPKNATLGLYDLRVRFNDTGLFNIYKLFSNWFYLNDSLLVLNNVPWIEDLTLSNNSALLGDSISIWLNATDVEEIESNLTIELEYRDPNEQYWNTTYLNIPQYLNNRLEYSFSIPFNAPFGYFDFRARCNDSDGNYSAWLYSNDFLLIYNTGPNVIDMKLSGNSVPRTNSVFLYVNGSDYETPEYLLKFYTQVKPNSKSDWGNLTGEYSDSNNRWETEFITNIETILGFYDLRVRFEDNESALSGWVYLNDTLEVLNNPPIISEDLDDINVDLQPLIFELTPYENDIEDADENLTWSIEPQTYTYIESATIIDTINDTLKIIPKENLTGNEDLELILTDKDGGTAVRSDITIHVDSRITEFTPKVILLSPPDNSIVTTLTPTLKWNLDYSGSELITYTVSLDENPEPVTELKTGLSTTEYTLDTGLEDGKTYYWKVLPTNGICLSEPFRFKIDLSFEPIFRVNLTSEQDLIIIKQDESKEINLIVKNEGNVVDNFKIRYNSANLQLQVNINKTDVQLAPNIDTKLKLSINIPLDFTIGDYSIAITATSLSDETVRDEAIINIKVVSKDFVPEYKINITVTPGSLELEPGNSDNVTLTITNEGNILDDYNIRFESNDFTSGDVQLSKLSLELNSDDSGQITVKVTVPENMQPGEYTIKFIIESDYTSDEATLTIKVKEKGDKVEPEAEKDNKMVYVLVGIIVIIIIMVIILLFFFVIKKKMPKEQEPMARFEPDESIPPQPVIQPEQRLEVPQITPAIEGQAPETQPIEAQGFTRTETPTVTQPQHPPTLSAIPEQIKAMEPSTQTPQPPPDQTQSTKPTLMAAPETTAQQPTTTPSPTVRLPESTPET